MDEKNRIPPLMVAVIKWNHGDGIAEAIYDALVTLGHCPVYFYFDEPLCEPENVDIVFSFAPYGDFLTTPRFLSNIPKNKKPLFVHWDIEGIPNPNTPWLFQKSIGSILSMLGRLKNSKAPPLQALANVPPLKFLVGKNYRFRLDGDYHYAYRRGWMDLFFETSQIYAGVNVRHGLPTVYVPWGTPPKWHADLKLHRDIDLLWMGARRSNKRVAIVDRIRDELIQRNKVVYIADGEENPYIFGNYRTEILNRSKICLNLLPAWYFNSFAFRFHIAAGNRAMVISEPILDHCPDYVEGEHYIAAEVDQLIETIVYYLENEKERSRIADNAYKLVTTQMTFQHSVNAILEKSYELICFRRAEKVLAD